MNLSIWGRCRWPRWWWALALCEPLFVVGVYVWFEINRPIGILRSSAGQSWRTAEISTLCALFASWAIALGIATIVHLNRSNSFK